MAAQFFFVTCLTQTGLQESGRLRGPEEGWPREVQRGLRGGEREESTEVHHKNLEACQEEEGELSVRELGVSLLGGHIALLLATHQPWVNIEIRSPHQPRVHVCYIAYTLESITRPLLLELDVLQGHSFYFTCQKLTTWTRRTEKCTARFAHLLFPADQAGNQDPAESVRRSQCHQAAGCGA